MGCATPFVLDDREGPRRIAGQVRPYEHGQRNLSRVGQAREPVNGQRRAQRAELGYPGHIKELPIVQRLLQVAAHEREAMEVGRLGLEACGELIEGCAHRRLIGRQRQIH